MWYAEYSRQRYSTPRALLLYIDTTPTSQHTAALGGNPTGRPGVLEIDRPAAAVFAWAGAGRRSLCSSCWIWRALGAPAPRSALQQGSAGGDYCEFECYRVRVEAGGRECVMRADACEPEKSRSRGAITNLRCALPLCSSLCTLDLTNKHNATALHDRQACIALLSATTTTSSSSSASLPYTRHPAAGQSPISSLRFRASPTLAALFRTDPLVALA